MFQYRYKPLPPGPGSTRLLRLRPNADETAPIECQLFDYSLQGSSKWTNLYEALSYVWGGSDRPCSISIDKHDLPVTANLHAALSQLRDRSIERIIWVDAICINQADLQERGHQVQSMAEIYSKAIRVIVWLGEAADNSDQALEGICVAAEKRSLKSMNRESILQAILALLQRTWFRRIWVLQEVAVARHVLIMCGSIAIDGYAFCLGLNSLKLAYTTCPDSQSLIRSVTYLIRRSIFRSKHSADWSGTVSTNDHSLGQLIDTYHTHEATERHDKVYALLGMSSDNSKAASLVPDYKVPWEQVFQRLVRFLLCKELSLKTWCDREMAVIECKGCILGKVSSVQSDIAWDDTQNVHITPKMVSGYFGFKNETDASWTLQASAKPIRKGDFICLLHGALKPMIIRLHKDCFAVIVIAVTPVNDIETDSGYMKWQELSRSIKHFPYDFLLVWDWEESLGDMENQGEYETLIKKNNSVQGHPKAESKGSLEALNRLYKMALMLKDVREYEEAEERLQEGIGGYKSAFGEAHLLTLTCMNNLALLFLETEQWGDAESVLVQEMQIKRQLQGVDHPDTLRSMARLALAYRKQGHLDRAENLEIMAHTLKGTGHHAQITEEMLVEIAQKFDEEVMTFLLNRRGGDIQITERVLEAAAKNIDNGTEVMSLLLERGGGDIQITEKVLMAATENIETGTEVMTLLLERRGDDVQITEDVFKTAVMSYTADLWWGDSLDSRRAEMMALLLKRRGGEFQITEKVVKTAMKSKEIIKLLLEQRGDEVQITEGLVETAMHNHSRGGTDALAPLLEHKGDDVQFTEEGVNEAAWNEEKEGAKKYSQMQKRESGHGEEIRVHKEETLLYVIKSSDERVTTLLLEVKRDGKVELRRRWSRQRLRRVGNKY